MSHSQKIFIMTLLAVFVSRTSCLAQTQPGGIPGADSTQVIIYHAGSLNAAFNSLAEAFTKKTGIPVVHRGFGAVDAARRATVGKEPVDIYATVDFSNIDMFLKPAYADYNIRYATGAEVLAYTTDSRGASKIADPNSPAFNPPASIPNAAPDWYTILLADSVRIGGSDPNLDPGGYRALMVMQLAEKLYGIPTGNLQKKYIINQSGARLGTDYDYAISYEHSARSTARTNANYRYVRLSATVGLSDPANEKNYNQASFVVSGLASGDPSKTVQGTSITFGLTVLKTAPHPAEALSFLQFMLSPEGMELQKTAGIDPIAPVVSRDDFQKLPGSLQKMVKIVP